MKFSLLNKGHRVFCAAVLGSAAVVLSSCDEEQPAETKAAEVLTVQPAAEPEQKPAEPETKISDFDSSRDALFDHAVFVLSQKLGNAELYPEVNNEVKEMLALLNNYAAALENEKDMQEERARVALLVAGLTCDLGAFDKAYAAYEKAMRCVDELPEDIRNGRDANRSRSTIESGLGACLLYRGRSADALPHFRKSLELDEAIFAELHPETDKPLPEGPIEPETALAAASVLDSYRCLGDCMNVSGDTEEALATYKKGLEKVAAWRQSTPKMAIAYIKLLIAAGDLENSNGNTKGAYAMWYQAAGLSKQIAQGRFPLNIQSEAKRLNIALTQPLLRAESILKEELRQQQETAAAAQQPEAVTEPINPVPPPAEVAPAPVVTPETEASTPQPDKSRQQQRRNRRNR